MHLQRYFGLLDTRFGNNFKTNVNQVVYGLLALNDMKSTLHLRCNIDVIIQPDVLIFGKESQFRVKLTKKSTS